jgi:hypothetical protein
MSQIVTIVPPVGSPCGARVYADVNDIKSLMGFQNMCSLIVFTNDNIPIISYFDTAQRHYGTNVLASKLFGQKIRGNCVIGFIDGDMTIQTLKNIVAENFGEKNK